MQNYDRESVSIVVFSLRDLPFNSQNLISNSPYCLPCNSYDDSLENSELDQPIIL